MQLKESKPSSLFLVSTTTLRIELLPRSAIKRMLAALLRRKSGLKPPILIIYSHISSQLLPQIRLSFRRDQQHNTVRLFFAVNRQNILIASNFLIMIKDTLALPTTSCYIPCNAIYDAGIPTMVC